MTTNAYDGQFYGRSFRLLVGGLRIESIAKGSLIPDSLRVTFQIKRDKTIDPDDALFTIYGLAEESRNALENEPDLSCVFEAGYQSNLQQCFAGVVRRAVSVKESVDWATTLSVGDGTSKDKSTRPMATLAQVSKGWPAGTKLDTVFRDLLKVAGLEAGNVKDVVDVARTAGQGTLPRYRLIHGVAMRQVYQLARTFGFGMTVQFGAAVFFKDGSGTGSGIKLTPENGLIGTPKLDSKGVLSARALLLPDLLPATLVDVQSATAKGTFAVKTATQTGDSHGQEWHVGFTATPK